MYLSPAATLESVSTDDLSDAPRSSWREQAVARRLDPARARAEDRVQRFLDAAFELMSDNTSGIEFTVQEVVERSGQSLRSFYQYFGGKQELLLALFEETVLSTAERLRVQMLEEKNAEDRLHRIVVEYYRVCRPARRKNEGKVNYTPAMAQFAQQLLTAHPDEAALAFSPLVDLFEEALDKAANEGSIRTDMSNKRIAGVILEAIMFNVFSRTIAGAAVSKDDGDPAEELFQLVLNGIAKR